MSIPTQLITSTFKRLILSSYPSIAQQFPSDSIHQHILTHLNNPSKDSDLDSLPYPVLAHSGTPTSNHEPIFIYANTVASTLFDYPLKELIGLPSRLTAEPQERNSRKEMLLEAAQKGFISNYEGIRVTSKGKKFKISEALIWNLKDEQGSIVGQAALLPKWEYLD